jgi:ABC-type phosphate transport system substrate-binding protein
MKNSRTRKILVAAIVVIALAAVLAVLNSFEFSPDSSDASTFVARAQQHAPGITVNASALGASEGLRFFGENLARQNIQPVWLSIENQTDDQLALIPIAMDRITIHPTRLLIDFMVSCPLQPIERATSSF